MFLQHLQHPSTSCNRAVLMQCVPWQQQQRSLIQQAGTLITPLLMLPQQGAPADAKSYVVCCRDVAVSPAWQRSGLGRAMIERLTNQLVQDGISTITLYAEPQVCSDH